jgi:DegV family protein with EDD domain
MIIVGSKGMNLPRELAARLGIEQPDQPLVVDGVRYGVDDLTIDDCDRLIKTAKSIVALGASAADYVAVLKPLAERDRDILVLTGPRLVTTSFESATAAVRTLMTLPSTKGANIRVVDTGVLEIGCGLVALRCAAALRAGASPTEIMDICHAMVGGAHLAVLLDTLDYARATGRASFLKTLAANLMGVVPLLTIAGGEIRPIKTVPRDSDKASVIADTMIARFGRGRPVWVGINHGNVPTQAFDLEQKLKAAFDVRFTLSRVAIHSTYVTSGPRFLGATVFPVDHRFSGPP